MSSAASSTPPHEAQRKAQSGTQRRAENRVQHDAPNDSQNRGPSRAQKTLLRFVLAVVVVFSALAIARFHTFHNRTFDLAFYTRMAWGFVRLDLWMPLNEAHFFGLHLSPILIPIGALGTLLDWAGLGSIQTVLLVSQCASAGFAALCLARLAEVHLGGKDKRALSLLLLGAATLLFHPNLLHVLSYEAHPGTLALGPLAALLVELDLAMLRQTQSAQSHQTNRSTHAHTQNQRSSKARVIFFSLLMLSCREDLALPLCVLGVLFFSTPLRKTGLFVALFSLVYFAFFLVVLHPRHAPEASSFQLHFGHFGDSPSAVISAWLADPLALFAHVFCAKNLRYLALLLLITPLAIFRARFVLVAVPILAINLVSRFPTTTNLDSHYLTLAVPALVAAHLVSFRALEVRAAARGPRFRRVLIGCALTLSAVLFLFLGVPKLSAFTPDARTEAAQAVLRVIPENASVAAPDELLPHLATRARFFRQVTEPGVPNRGSEFVVLNASHRERFRGREDLLRTLQEPVLRRWLARDDYGLVLVRAPYFVFRRGADGRSGRIAGRVDLTDLSSPSLPTPSVTLTRCLHLTGAREQGADVVLSFVATEPCAEDLAIRFDTSERRVDLLFEGELSPAMLRPGDLIESRHMNLSLPVSVGLLRSSGARPDPQDPTFVATELVSVSTELVTQ